MAKVTDNIVKTEALKRMKVLGLMGAMRKDLKYGRIYYSEDGILFWLDNNPEYVDAVRQFEQSHNALVYHCILNHTEMGDWLTMLYVSKNDEEWHCDWDGLNNPDPEYGFEQLAYVETWSFCSELGYVWIKPRFGGLVRTY